MRDAQVKAPSAGQSLTRLIHQLPQNVSAIWPGWQHALGAVSRILWLAGSEIVLKAQKDKMGGMRLLWRINCITVSDISRGIHVHPTHTATHCPRYQQSMQYTHTHTHTACFNNCLSLLTSAANQSWSAILLRSPINYSERIQHFSHQELDQKEKLRKKERIDDY